MMDLYTKLYYEYDEIKLEALVENAMTTSVDIIEVSVKPNDGYSSKRLDMLASGEPIFQDEKLNPGDSRVYLFSFKCKDITQIYLESIIGELQIKWRSLSGEYSQEWPLIKEASSHENYILNVEENPAIVQLDKIFHITYRLTNCSDRETNPILSMKNTKELPILFIGLSSKSLGILKPQGSLLFRLTFFPRRAGLHPLPEMQISDINLGKNYIFSKVAHVFIQKQVQS